MSLPLSPDDLEAISSVLVRRAKRLAEGSVVANYEAGAAEILVVGVGKATYAMRLEHLDGVLPIKSLTPLPTTPRLVAGLTVYQGQPVSVVRLGALLGQRQTDQVRAGVLLRIVQDVVVLGVDAYVGVRGYSESELSPMPGTVSPDVARCFCGMLPGDTGLLNMSVIAEILANSAESET